MNLATRGRAWSSRKLTEIGYLVGTGLRQHDLPTDVSTVSMLRTRAIVDSAEYFEPIVGDLALFATTQDLHIWVAEQMIPALPNGHALEFGYYQGDSARRFAPAVARRDAFSICWSFDAFQGLRDQWSSIGSSTGAYSLNGVVPIVPDGVRLVIGWVEDTLETWLEENPGPLSFVHMDLDVYPPTRFALDALRARLQPGCLVLFDELHGFPGWREHEFRALQEAWSGIRYDYVAIGPEQALIRVC